jgi:hypothetical protein
VLEVDGGMLQVGEEVVVHSEVRVEAAACSKAEVEAVVCSGAEIEDDRQW